MKTIIRKKIYYCLRTLIIFMTIVAVFCGVILSLKNASATSVTPSDGDVFSTSMEVLKIGKFENGNVLVLGKFLQGDNIEENTSVFVKSYNSKGVLLNTGSFEIPSGTQFDSVVFGENEALLMLTPKNTADGSPAHLYRISSKAENLGVVEVPGAANCTFFQGYNKGEPYCVTTTDFDITVYDFDLKALFKGNKNMDTTLTAATYSDNTFICCGRTEVDGKMTACYMIYEGGGDELGTAYVDGSSLSVCDNIILGINDDQASFYITGRYFDKDTYADTFYKNTDVSAFETEITKLGNEALSASSNLGQVLLSSDYFSAPWVSHFIWKVDKEGKISESLSPFSENKSFGIANSDVIVSDNGYIYDNCCYYVSSMAANADADSYSLTIYTLDNTGKLSNSAVVTMPSDFEIICAVSESGEFITYISENKENSPKQYQLKIYDNIEDFAKEQNEKAFVSNMISIVDNLDTEEVVFYLTVFILLAISVGMKRYDI